MTERYSVLFVDDEINVLNSLERGLLDQEYKCFFALSGKKALEIMEKENICVIVSDMRMPEMDGLTLLRIIKEKYPRTVRIVLSGYAQLQQILLTVNTADVFKFITKPWKLEEEFISVINSAIEYYKTQEENERIKMSFEEEQKNYAIAIDNAETKLIACRKQGGMLSGIGKLLISFNKDNILNESIIGINYFKLLEALEDFYEILANAVYEEEAEYMEDELIAELTKEIQKLAPIKSFDNKIELFNKVRVNNKIIKAVLLAYCSIFKEEFHSNGLYLLAGKSPKDEMVFSLLCPNSTGEHSSGKNTLPLSVDGRIKFIKEVFSNIEKIYDISFSVTKSSGNIIMVILFKNSAVQN